MLESNHREFLCVYIIYNFYKAQGVIVSSEAFEKVPDSLSLLQCLTSGHPVL